jgi:hypothetical protein
MIIGTTSMKHILQDMELVDCFNVSQSVPHVHDAHEFEAVLSNFSNNKQVIQEAASVIET